MLSLTTLASGSSGNCALLSTGSTHILVDVGISARRITKALGALGLSPRDLAGLLITHEHSDHIAGLSTLTKQFRLPVYASHGTGRQLCYRMAALEDVLVPFDPGASFAVGAFEVTAIPTCHDAAESVAYTASDGQAKAAVVTDLGEVTDAVLRGVCGCDLLLVETNHDTGMVADGPYPYFLKQRILGVNGHLSNEAGAALAVAASVERVTTVILGHLSAENNSPALARRVVCAALAAAGLTAQKDVAVTVAPRAETGAPVRAGERVAAR